MEAQLGESEQVGTIRVVPPSPADLTNLRLDYSLYPPASPCPRPSGLRHDHDGSGDRLCECTPAEITVCRSTALHRLSLPRVSTAGPAIGQNRLLLQVVSGGGLTWRSWAPACPLSPSWGFSKPEDLLVGFLSLSSKSLYFPARESPPRV